MTDLTPERVRAWLDAGHSTNSDDAPNFEAVARSWLKQREALDLAMNALSNIALPYHSPLLSTDEGIARNALQQINALLGDGK